MLLAGGVSPAGPVSETIMAATPPDVTPARSPVENETLNTDPETFLKAIETQTLMTESALNVSVGC